MNPIGPRTREVVEEAYAAQSVMHDERESLPSSAWEYGDADLALFLSAAYPTLAAQKQ
jgi:hypothetical protein